MEPVCRAHPGTTREHAGTGARAVPQVRAAGPSAAARLLWPQRGCRSAPPPAPCRVLSSLPPGVDKDGTGMTCCARWPPLSHVPCEERGGRESLFTETWTPEQQLSDATRPGCRQEPVCPRGLGGIVSISRASTLPGAMGREGRGFPGGRKPDSEFALGAQFSADPKSKQSCRADRCCSLLCGQSSSPTLGLAGPRPGGSECPPPRVVSPEDQACCLRPRARCCSASLPGFPVCPES